MPFRAGCPFPLKMNHYSWTFYGFSAAVVHLTHRQLSHVLDNLQLTFFFYFTVSRSASGLQIPKVFSWQALHHWLLPKAPWFFAEEVREFVIKNERIKLENTVLPYPSASGEECASIFACSFPPDPPPSVEHRKHTLFTHSEKPCECKPQYLCNNAYIWTLFCDLVYCTRGNTT